MFQVKLHMPFNMRWLIAGKWTQRVQVDTKGTSGCKRLGLLPLVSVISINHSYDSTECSRMMSITTRSHLRDFLTMDILCITTNFGHSFDI